MTEELAYLKAEVMSASGPKLRLMLIEAALRFARQSLPELKETRLEPALQKLARVREIFWELLNSVGATEGDIADNIRRVYHYLIRAVTEAQLSGDPKKVADIVKVLEVERETWREVSFRFLVETAGQPPCTMHGPEGVLKTPSISGGFSVDA